MAEALLNINSNINILLIGDGIEKNSLVQEAINKKVYKKIFLLNPKFQKMKFSHYFVQLQCVQIL